MVNNLVLLNVVRRSMNFRLKTISLKHLLIKTIVFLIPWCGSLFLVNIYKPDLIDWTKLITNTYSNTLAFLVAYILTMIGFRYSNRKDIE